MSKRITILDVFTKTEDIELSLAIYKEYKTTSRDKVWFANEMNALFDTEFTYELWLRYIAFMDRVVELNTFTEESLKAEFIKEKEKLKIQNTINKRTERALLRKEHWADIVKEHLPEFEKGEKLFTKEIIDVSKIQNIFIADLHYQNNGDFLKVWNSIEITGETVNIYFTGDEIQGTLRTEDMLNGSNPMKQVSNLVKEIVQVVEGCEKILRISVIPGNHTEVRASNVYGESNPNFSELFSTMLDMLLPHTIVNYKEEFYLYVRGIEYVLIHGHQFKSKTAAKNFYKDKPVVPIISHWHNFEMNNEAIFLPTCESVEHDMSFAKSIGCVTRSQVVSMIDGYFKVFDVF